MTISTQLPSRLIYSTKKHTSEIKKRGYINYEKRTNHTNKRRNPKILPHRYPFLLIDKIVDFEEGKSITGIKNVTANEPQFTGHFPGNPIMPGVLITEALAQVGAVMLLSMPENRGKLGVFTGINNFKFRRQVVPGDTLELHADLVTYVTEWVKQT